ncbi:MAG: hypothetical protein A2289_15285 [Deltaproteobacteria bacterium RIFOXYA12_FULL_58_15]|nr:MAG: hypothetical protein A2289_15285 [Deltaproteobacteria bacterium RIFOXYA12_FULL_58_15]OGR10250.1 MAG: hypothetical protein A2341_22085 [Deltaproteobacteria bacterium RIFOXYB12_FULL_58_9]
MKKSAKIIIVMIVGTMPLTACGDDPKQADYLPMAVGNRWVYEQVLLPGGGDDGLITKELTGTEAYAGDETFIMMTTQTNGEWNKRSNWGVDGAAVTRLRQTVLDGDTVLWTNEYQPGFLRMDSSKVGDNASFKESHLRVRRDAGGVELDRDNKEYSWTVETTDEEVAVSAGKFSCTRIRRVDEKGAWKLFWYAEGIGKVRERGDTSEERLAEYTLK